MSEEKFDDRSKRRMAAQARIDTAYGLRQIDQETWSKAFDRLSDPNCGEFEEVVRKAIVSR